MRRTVHTLVRTGLALGLSLGLITASLAQQAWPNRPIRFVVGFSAGGITDIVARIMAEHVRNRLGQPVTVENRTGANGVLAAQEVLRAPPDGHTVLISNSSTLTLNPLLARKPPYEAADFAPVSLMVSYPFVIATNPTSEKAGAATTLPEFLKLARERPGQFTYGSTGNGGLVHLGLRADDAREEGETLGALGRGERGADEVKPALNRGVTSFGHGCQRQDDGQDEEGKVKPEGPSPRDICGEPATNQWADSGHAADC